MVPLKTGDIVSDFNDYLNQSEQIPSHVWMFSNFSQDGTLQASYGLMIQNIPDKATSSSSKDDITNVVQKIGNIPWQKFQEMECQEILQSILPFEFTVINSTPLDFFCRCSIERFKNTLKSMPLTEILDMQHNNQTEILCKYCNQTYILSSADFEEILEEITKNNQKN